MNLYLFLLLVSDQMKRETELEFSPEEEDIVAKMFRLVGKRLTLLYHICQVCYMYCGTASSDATVILELRKCFVLENV